MATAHLSVSVLVSAPVQEVWDATTDWERQSGWMLGTRVRGTAQGGRGVGGGIEAWTGIGPIGFLDTMVITAWEPPHRCLVEHTGRLLKGSGAFEVADAGDGVSRLTWTEDIKLPLGVLGRIGWPLVRPVVRLGIAHSLGKLAAAVSRRD
ncbi:MAG TPA: SRPBCC family protein [Actinocrinis sp.]|uniref:SRPBCC family protein n=1 Tax=Actinocrinis sp. TaxID=1920516 RepID=UPI002D337966|nr:SRPBCC family protein [Actinocrinis sp.]HZU56391.1 SRPBCC family protein [Actinocrinis sp.]